METIGKMLADIYVSDMTSAEKQIAEYLVEHNFGQWHYQDGQFGGLIFKINT